MSVVRTFLFPHRFNDRAVSLFLLAMRILFGVLLLSHGLQKLINFTSLSSTFPDPLGVGSTMSLSLAIFGELFCSVAFIFGFMYRLAMLPMIFTMSIAFFVIHAGDPFASKEFAFVYLAVFILLYITGPGRYSLDYMISKSISKE